MTHTYKGSVVSKAIKDFIVTKQVELGINAVYYGDQAKFPLNPAVCVEPAMTTRTLVAMPYQTDNDFLVNILVYHTSSSIGDGIEIIQEECDDLSERLQDVINAESIAPQFAGGTRFGDIIISGHCTRLEFGYRILSDRLMRCNRLVWEGKTRTRLLD